ncbi:MAG: chemotaxis protein CheB [Nisaea sp.]|uniref:CheB methylesterase domain-containing protein n=1 Tax=Nisaea sp. TaxID=2024842 RepID=UPI001B0FE05E|nr:CheB methylesterase domain-containing protein [Nisaea sp.]MBO6559674.1 chemotaxis protein CheB [Nisaea sp.]
MSASGEILVVALDPLLRKVVAENVTPFADGATVTSISQTRATPERLSGAAIVVLAARDADFAGLRSVFALVKAANRPTLLVTAGESSEGRAVAADLRIGGSDHIAIPELDIREELRAVSSKLESAIRQARRDRPRNAPAPAQPQTPPARAPMPPPPEKPRPVEDTRVPYLGTVICIGASTGGTDALLTVLSGLDRNCPPIAIVQHMPKDYVPDFAKRLDQSCRIDVELAHDGQALRPGLAVVAPGDRQFRLRKGNKGIWTALGESERIGGHCPAVDVMMKSAAQELGKKAVGVILTGMGRDGADGLLAMRQAGARTAAQDEETSIVYGMPKVAFEEKAADTVLPLQKIASWISGATLQLPK